MMPVAPKNPTIINRIRKWPIRALSGELTECNYSVLAKTPTRVASTSIISIIAEVLLSPLTTRGSHRQTTESSFAGFRRAPTGIPEDRCGSHIRLLAMEQTVSYTLDSTLDTVDHAEEKATRIATELGFAEDEIMQISMAVREGAVNAVLHGNAYAPDKKVILAFERTPEDLVITIRDQGRGIDLGNIPNPLAPENLLKTSGRGIFLMRSFMDVVEIRPSQTGTEVKLIKHVRGSSAGGKERTQ